MKKRIIATIASLMLLCGCSGYSFDEKELSKAMGVSKSVFDEMDIAPGIGGDTGVELFDDLAAAKGADSYTYFRPHTGSTEEYDVIELFFYGGKVASVELSTYGCEKSEYSVAGIHIGDSRESAVAVSEELTGAQGSALSDNEQMWDLTDKERDMITFSGKKIMFLYIDTETDTVCKIDYDG